MNIKIETSSLDPLAVNVSGDAETMAKLQSLINDVGQAPVVTGGTPVEVLPMPRMSFGPNDSGPLNALDQLLNAPSGEGQEVLLLPIMNFDKKPVASSKRNVPAENHAAEDVLLLPVMDFGTRQ